MDRADLRIEPSRAGPEQLLRSLPVQDQAVVLPGNFETLLLDFLDQLIAEIDEAERDLPSSGFFQKFLRERRKLFFDFEPLGLFDDFGFVFTLAFGFIGSG
jgi:hypothetical protein